MTSAGRGLTSDEYHRLVEAAIVGPRRAARQSGRHRWLQLGFSDAQITAAADVGVDLRPADAIAALGRTLDRRAYPSGYLKREREGWRE
jgi:hypothetical protein